MNKKLSLMHVILLIPIIGLSILIFTSSVVADDSNPEFLFLEDQKIGSKDPSAILKDIDMGNEIENNSWFKSPPTRIEMLGLVLNQHHKESMDKELISSTLDDYFEPKRKVHTLETSEIEIKSNVFFSEEQGGFIVTLHISGLGKPRQSMKKAATDLISLVGFFGNYRGEGYEYHNTFMQPFNVFPNTSKDEIIKILKKKFIIVVSLRCEYDNKRFNPTLKGYQGIKDQYYLAAIKRADKEEIVFTRDSLTISLPK